MDAVFDVNVKGMFLVSRAVARAMVDRGNAGRIVNISSGAAESGRIGAAHYCASKAAVNMFTKVLALELAPHGIVVNAVGPGSDRGPGWSLDQDYIDTIVVDKPDGRIGQPEDVARAVLYLASPAATYITGTSSMLMAGNLAGRPLPLSMSDGRSGIALAGRRRWPAREGTGSAAVHCRLEQPATMTLGAIAKESPMANFPWPNGNRCAAVLSFDMDGECIPFVYDTANAVKRLSLQSEATYGPNVGMPRIFDLLDRHDIPASFFVPGFTAERHPDILREMIRRGHEVGHHGYLHERPDFVDEDEEERIMVRGLEVLEAITGVRPRGYRSPAWELKPTSPALLKKYGFVYDSSLMGDDEPYLSTPGTASACWRFPCSGSTTTGPTSGSGRSRRSAPASPARRRSSRSGRRSSPATTSTVGATS